MHSFKLEFLDYQPRVMFSFLDILGKDRNKIGGSGRSPARNAARATTTLYL